jgi:hypothetical protein
MNEMPEMDQFESILGHSAAIPRPNTRFSCYRLFEPGRSSRQLIRGGSVRIGFILLKSFL